MSTTRVGIVGAGFSGAVIAHQLAAAGHEIEVFEALPHIAGNCFTQRDEATGVLVHRYGPHIFHTSSERVWNFIGRFDHMMPFTNRVKAIVGKRVFTLPINLLTINQFFGKTFSPAQAGSFLESLADRSITQPASFEEQALAFVGQDLYAAFFRGYTRKQWGVEPSQLPASILKRLPVRFNYDDNYYASSFQGMPLHGYTHIVEALLTHPKIRLHLNERFVRSRAVEFDHVFCTGPIDGWFDHDAGRLAYRTLDFQVERHDGDFQGNAVINYCDADVPWTRISEHKHFAPWEFHAGTVIFKEFSRTCGAGDTPYYPVRLLHDKALLSRYVARARDEANVTFAGRLGTYRYLDMHVAIEESLDAAQRFIAARTAGEAMPAFTIDPLG